MYIKSKTKEKDSIDNNDESFDSNDVYDGHSCS